MKSNSVVVPPRLAGRLTVRTEPAGAAVLVDGMRRGLAPITVSDLPPGQHQVIIRTRHGELRQDVEMGAGESLSVVVPLAVVPTVAAPAASETGDGFLVVRAPFEVRIVENDRLLGTSAMQRVPLERGSHSLILKNDDLGLEEPRTVSVTPGKTVTLSLAVPTQRVAINAVPWAEVWVDGQRVGETPIGAVKLPLGPHAFVFRHPTLGEKQARIVVKATEAPRVTVDMSK